MKKSIGQMMRKSMASVFMSIVLAAAGIGLTILSGISKNKTFKKTHKPLSIFSALATILHIGLIEYYHYKYRAK